MDVSIYSFDVSPPYPKLVSPAVFYLNSPTGYNLFLDLNLVLVANGPAMSNKYHKVARAAAIRNYAR